MIGTVLALAAAAVAFTVAAVLLSLTGPMAYTDRPLPPPRLPLWRSRCAATPVPADPDRRRAVRRGGGAAAADLTPRKEATR